MKENYGRKTLVELVPGGKRWALLHSSATLGLPASVKYCVRQCGYNMSGTVSAKNLTLCCRDRARKEVQHSTQLRVKESTKRGYTFSRRD